MNLKNAQIRKISTMADKGVEIELITGELPPDQMATLFLMYSNAEMFTGEEFDLPEQMEEKKSPAQRLRAVLHVLWTQTVSDKTKTGFETFYKRLNCNNSLSIWNW